MDKDLRDYLLEVFCSLTALQNMMSENPLVGFIIAPTFRKMCALKYITAKMYHSLADEKDLSVLDEDGFPVQFQIKRMAKIMNDSLEEFNNKMDKLEGRGHYISLRHGDIVRAPKKEPSKCDDCGHVHD